MDEIHGLCEGCLRTLDEIRLWSVSSDAEKRVVWSCIADRAAALTNPTAA
jgi:predicted Fe-S protein YdhL (DUF1289 family)